MGLLPFRFRRLGVELGGFLERRGLVEPVETTCGLWSDR